MFDLERYSIHELSEITGISKRNIRYYIVQGLLPSAEGHSPSSTYRMTHRLRLEAIKEFKQRRLSLDEMREIFLKHDDNFLRETLGYKPLTHHAETAEPAIIANWQTAGQKPAVFSFFAGAGMLDLGFEHASFDVVYVNDIRKPFLWAHYWSRLGLDTAEPRFGYFRGGADECVKGRESSRITHLIKRLRMEKRLVGFIGGPPYQDFSVAGRRKGRAGKMGRLSQTYADLIITHKPDFFFFENVQGLVMNHRKFLNELVDQFRSNGYSVSVRLLNSLEFGVPQNRKRIMIVGFSSDSGLGDAEILNWRRYTDFVEGECFNLTWPDQDVVVEHREHPPNIPLDLTVQYWFEQNDVENHYNSHLIFKPEANQQTLEAVPEGFVGGRSYRRYHRWRYAPALTFGDNEVLLHPYKNRSISVAEALALQTLPKEFTFPLDISKTQMFKMIGNGVPYLMALKIAQAIRDHIDRQRKGGSVVRESGDVDHVPHVVQSA